MKKILAVRNDKLGDFILILPALKMLKNSFPNIRVECLVNESVADIAKISNYIDEIIIDNDRVYHEIKKREYDYSISFFSTFRVGYMLSRCEIKKRYAPATKLAQIFYNKKLKQNRSKSNKAEYDYNIDLVKFFLDDIGAATSDVCGPYLTLPNEVNRIERENKIIYLHPFTGGSSKTFSSDTVINLCREIQKYRTCNFILHCDIKDYQKCLEIKNAAEMENLDVIKPSDNLLEMCSNINKCDIFIAGSTGPLHVAAALNKKTVGFYPSKVSSTSLRWKTINDENKSISFDETDGSSSFIEVDIKNVASVIYNKLIL